MLQKLVRVKEDVIIILFSKMSNILRNKKVIQVRDKKVKHLPRKLPPMERPETPMNELRSGNSQRGNDLHNLSISRFTYLNEEKVSSFRAIKELFEEAKNSDDIVLAIQSFETKARNLYESKCFTSCDLIEYRQVYPFLTPLIKTAPGPVLFQIVNALSYILKAIESSKDIKPKEPTIPKIGKTNSRFKNLEPLPPLDSETRKQSAKEEELPTEHFYNFISILLVKISSDKANDEIFLNTDLIQTIISLTGPSHKLKTRIYAITTIKNEARNNNFRKLLLKVPGFSELFDIFQSTTDGPDLLEQCALAIRNLISDAEYLDIIVKHNIHTLLFASMLNFTDNIKYCYACFRILTKISSRDNILQSLLKSFPEDTILTLFYTLLDKHKTNPLLVSRLSYVFADFASQENSFIEVASKITEPYSLSIIFDVLEVSEIIENNENALTLIIQVVANLSVNKECASILSFGDSISKFFSGRTFNENDRLGYNLLCTASNFTFHDHYWSPKNLIEALPNAIISKYVPSIIEALRTLCNLALVPNSMLIDSKIFELLGILINHINPDIVLYSLQTLANLINHAGIRRRFRSAGLVESLLELIRSDNLDEMELDAIAALIMNFGAITAEEAQDFYKALDEFEIPQDAEIPNIFKDFLKQQMRVDC